MYCTRHDIETIYGRSNVEQWADLDNDGIEAQIRDRIDATIAGVTDLIDVELRDLYELPLSAPLPSMVVRAAALLAGCRLYEARGSQDINEVTGQPLHRYAAQHREARDTIGRLRGDIIRLDQGYIGPERQSPAVVDDPVRYG